MQAKSPSKNPGGERGREREIHIRKKFDFNCCVRLLNVYNKNIILCTTLKYFYFTSHLKYFPSY